MLKEVERLSNLINNIRTKQPKQLSCVSFLQQYLKDVISLQSLVKEENMKVILVFKWHYWQGRKKYSLPYKNNTVRKKCSEMNKIHLGWKSLGHCMYLNLLLWNMHQLWKVILCQGKWNIGNCTKYSAMTLEYCVGLHSQPLPCLMSEIMDSSSCVIMLTWQKQALCEAFVSLIAFLCIEKIPLEALI